MELSVRRAVLDDIDQLHDVVNWAYRGKPKSLWQTVGDAKCASEEKQSGWTGEQDLVVGARVCKEDLQTMLAENGKGNHVILVCVATGSSLDDEKKTKGVVAGSIKIAKEGEGEVDFGLFGVDPEFQSRGIGKRLFEAGEVIAREEFKAHTGVLCVVHCRDDIQAMYKRWGFQPTGATVPFPQGGVNGNLVRKDVYFLVFKKPLVKASSSAIKSEEADTAVDAATATNSSAAASASA